MPKTMEHTLSTNHTSLPQAGRQLTPFLTKHICITCTLKYPDMRRIRIRESGISCKRIVQRPFVGGGRFRGGGGVTVHVVPLGDSSGIGGRGKASPCNIFQIIFRSTVHEIRWDSDQPSQPRKHHLLDGCHSILNSNAFISL